MKNFIDALVLWIFVLLGVLKLVEIVHWFIHI